MNIGFKKLKKFFKKKLLKKIPVDNNYNFPDISYRLVNFFSFADDMRSISVPSINNTTIFKSDRIIVLYDKYLYSFLIMNDFVSVFYIENNKNYKKFNDDIIMMVMSNHKPSEIYTPQEKIFEFLEKRFKNKLRKLKVDEIL